MIRDTSITYDLALNLARVRDWHRNAFLVCGPALIRNMAGAGDAFWVRNAARLGWSRNTIRRLLIGDARSWEFVRNELERGQLCRGTA